MVHDDKGNGIGGLRHDRYFVAINASSLSSSLESSLLRDESPSGGIRPQM
jgi:hypothetical protein